MIPHLLLMLVLCDGDRLYVHTRWVFSFYIKWRINADDAAAAISYQKKKKECDCLTIKWEDEEKSLTHLNLRSWCEKETHIFIQ